MEERSRLFQSLQKYEYQPPQSVWTHIERRLDAPQKSILSRSKKWIVGVAAVILAAAIIIGLFALLHNENETLPNPISTPTIEPMIEQATVTLISDTVSMAAELPDVVETTLPSAAKIIQETSIVIPPQSEEVIKPVAFVPEKITETPHVEQLPQEPEPTVMPTASTENHTEKDTAVPVVLQNQPVVVDTQFDQEEEMLQPTFVMLHQDQNICRGESAILRIAQGKNVVWNTGDNASIITVYPKETTTYQVRWEQNNQCFQSEITVSVLPCSIFVPNAFSPNGDGMNDVFRPVGEGITNYNMLIFGINGDRLFESKDISIGWDGISSGTHVKSGVYIYRISFQDGTGQKRSMQGSFNLLP